MTFRLRPEGRLRVNHVWSSTEPGKSEEVKEACVAGGGKERGEISLWRGGSDHRGPWGQNAFTP